jgi:glycosyltransferase involved in cell wall biosynthesis
MVMPPWQTPEEAGRSWTEEGVEIRYVPLQGGLPTITRRVIQETNAWQPDVVHTFKPKAYSGLAAWWLWHFRRRQIRLVTDTDDWEGWGGWNDLAPYSPLQKHFFAWQEQWGLKHCHILTVASRSLESLAWASGVPPERVVYLPNGPGINDRTEKYPARRAELGLADRPVLLLYSRLFEFDTSRLVAVLARVKTAVPDFRLLVVGASLYREDSSRLQEQLQAAGLSEHIVETGWLEESLVPDTLAAADVGLYLMDDTLLNRTKCPVKLADMAFVGLPVVAESIGQVTEYVQHEQTGLVCPVGDVAGLGAAVVRLLQDKSKQQQFSAAARIHMRQSFTWDKLAEHLESVYQQSP